MILQKPFLTFVTRRHPHRPKSQELNYQALRILTDDDWEQVFIDDPVGLGVYEANCMLLKRKDRVNGQYVYIYDDDNIVTCPTLITDLKEIVAQHDSDVIIVKMVWMGGTILPRDQFWGKFPQQGEIDSLNFVVRGEVWKKHIGAFAQPRCGDYHFIREIFNCNYNVYWHDCVVAAVLRVGNGQPDVA